MKKIYGYDPEAAGLKIYKLRPNGEFIVYCPTGNHKRPHGSFNPMLGTCYCFSCKSSYNIYQLVRLLHGHIVKKQFELPEPPLERSEWFKLLDNPLALDHYYLKHRQVSNDLVKHYQIKSTGNSIIFPFFNQDKKIKGLMERKLKGDIRYVFYGELPVIYPEHEFTTDHDKIILVEGIFGFLRAKASGYDNVYSIMGSHIKNDLKQYLVSYGRKTYGIFDNDYAGHKAGQDLIKKFPGSRVLIPGLEADEISTKQWQDIFQDYEFCSSIKQYKQVTCD